MKTSHQTIHIGDTVKVISGEYAGVIGTYMGQSKLVSGKVVIQSTDTKIYMQLWPKQIRPVEQ